MDAQQTIVWRDVCDLDVVGDDVFLEPLRDRRAVTGFEVEQDFVRQDIDVQVALHLCLRVDQRGVTTFPDLQIFHVVGDLAVEKFLPISAEETESRPEAQVENGGRTAQRGVFGEGVAVMINGLYGVDVREAGAQASMKFVECE